MRSARVETRRRHRCSFCAGGARTRRTCHRERGSRPSRGQDRVVSGLLMTMNMNMNMSTNTSPPVRQHPEVRQYMTASPLTIRRGVTLDTAIHMMREHHVRHLPVLDGGRFVGLVTQRDLLLIESLPGIDPARVPVDEAMIEDVFTVAPETAVGEAIERMIDLKLGSAIVCEGDRVVGVFTTVDALTALHHLLERR